MDLKKLGKALLFPHIAIMNLALALIIFFMVYFNRTFEQHMITAIAMAAYTFTALTTAIYMIVTGTKKLRQFKSEVKNAQQ